MLNTKPTPTHILSQVKNQVVKTDLRHNSPDLKTRLLAFIDSEKEDIKVLRSVAGLHRLSSDKGKSERWEITEAKLLQMNVFRSFVQELPDDSSADNLVLEKLNSSMFRDWLVSQINRLRADEDSLEVYPLLQGKLGAWILALEAFDDFRESDQRISGNAGEQPGQREEGSDAKKPRPAPTFLDLLNVVPGKVTDLSANDLIRISDWCLDNLESMGLEDRWQESNAGAVGEGDMPFSSGS